MGNNVEIKELNIQPQAGVIGVFSRLNYKAWYAIAEFVDNSTQSFYSHQIELSQKRTDGEAFLLLRRLLFAGDYLIILKQLRHKYSV